MKKISMSFILALILVGCGVMDNISIHNNTPLSQLEQMAGYPVLGYAKWKDFGPAGKECDIYLAPVEIINSYGEECYDALLSHEERHCAEGDFHPNTSEGSAIPECR
jgi:hypothetical protein